MTSYILNRSGLTWLKETASARFFVTSFFIQRPLLVPIGTSRADTDFFLFVELFIFTSDSLVMNTYSRKSIRSPQEGNFVKHKPHIPQQWIDLQSILKIIAPSKTVVCSLKSVKQLPCVQKDSLAMNKPGKSRLPCDGYSGETTSQFTWNKHQSRFTNKLFGTNRRRVKTPQCISHREVLTP